MQKRTLRQDLSVSAIGLGCMGMDHAYGPPRDRREMIKLIHTAVELGCTYFDTAQVYGEENEKIVGEALKDLHDRVVVSTKCGLRSFASNGGGRMVMEPDNSRAFIRESLEGSLKRLQMECVDLLYLHRWDENTPIEEIARTMQELIREGKIRHWGLSVVSAQTLRDAHAVSPVTALQSQYSMMWRGPETEIFPTCEELGVGYVAYSPLGNGFLSGRYDRDTRYPEGDYRNFMGRFRPEVIERNQALLQLIANIAERKQATSAQIALAWVLAQKPYLVPIPGTTKLERLKENLGAAEVELTQAELADLNEALSAMDIDETHF